MTAIFLFLLGCPLPPEENTNNNNRAPQQNNGGSPPQQGQAGGANNAGGGNSIGTPPTPGGGGQNPGVVQGAAGGAPGGAPGGVLHDLGQLKEQKAQKEILAGDHVQIRGTISGECNGTVRLDVLFDRFSRRYTDKRSFDWERLRGNRRVCDCSSQRFLD